MSCARRPAGIASMRCGHFGTQDFTSGEVARPQERRRRYDATIRRSIVGVSRLLLAPCLGVLPDGLRFTYNAFRKPALAPGPFPHLHFNISHSGDWILLRFRLAILGVDVEHKREDMATAEIAARFFPAECSTLAALTQTQRCAAFF